MDKHDVVLNFKKPQKKPKKKKNKESNKYIKSNVKNETVEDLETKNEEEEKIREQIKKEEEQANLKLTMDLFGIDYIGNNDINKKENYKNNELKSIEDEYDEYAQ